MQTMRRVFYNTVIRGFHDFLLYGNFFSSNELSRG